MAFTDSTYYVREIAVPSSTYSDLTNYINRYEKEILKTLLGYELWELVNAYNVSTSPQRIKDIVEGKEYTVSYNGRDQKVKWNGLQNTDKISLLAYFVYYWYVRGNITTTHTVGETKSKQENSFNADVMQRVMNAWTRMRDLGGYVGQSVLEPSLYNFLLENESTYPEWVWTDPGSINSHDL